AVAAAHGGISVRPRVKSRACSIIAYAVRACLPADGHRWQGRSGHAPPHGVVSCDSSSRHDSSMPLRAGTSHRTGVTGRRNAMQIVDSQIHLWENAKMSPQHRQIPTYSMDDALQEMAQAGVDAAVLHPPSTLGEAVNVLAVEAVRQHPDKFCILGNFDLQSPDRLAIDKNWR